MAPQEKLFVPHPWPPVLVAWVKTPWSLLRIPVQAVIAEWIPTLTGDVLTSPIRVTFLVERLPIRPGRRLLPSRVRSFGTRSLRITAAPLELDILAIMASSFPGTLILSGPIARTWLAERRSPLRVNSLLGVTGRWTCRLPAPVRNGLTTEPPPVTTRGTSFLVTIHLLFVLVLGFTLTI